jgi:hypothetical protein
MPIGPTGAATENPRMMAFKNVVIIAICQQGSSQVE